MKKIKFLFGMLVMLSFVFMFSSCDDPSVQITISPAALTAEAGETVFITYTLTPDALENGELGGFTITDDDNNVLLTHDYSGGSSITDSLEFTIPPDAVEGSIITLTFAAIDSKSNNETKEFAVITVVLGYPEIINATDVQANYVSTSLDNSMMFDLGATGVTMEDGNFADGELAFVWQNTYGYSIVSPNSPWIAALYAAQVPTITYTTDDKQETKIMKYSGSWADLTMESIDTLQIIPLSISGGGIGVQNLNEGDIVVFETEDGRKGALIVKTNAKVSKYLTADLSYQAVAETAGK